MRIHTTAYLATLLSLALAGPVLAQDTMESHGGSRSGAVIKNRAPVNDEILKVTFPRPAEATLSNGLQVMVLEDHFLPKVLFQILIPHGSMDDPEDMPGLASFTADLLSEGAGAYSSREIANRLDGMGASFYASAEFGSPVTRIQISGLSEHTRDMVSLFATLILEPTFPPEEVDKYKARETAALQQQRTRPGFLANERFMSALYAGHPASVVAPTAESLAAVDPDRLKAFHATYYVPNGAILAVTGDVTFDQIVPLLEDAFGGWQPAEPPERVPPEIHPNDALTIDLVDRPNSVQTTLKLGNVGLTRTDPDYVAVNVLNQILGANASSRLFLKLREEKGYTYGAYSRFKAVSYPGPWYAGADVRTEVTGGALTEFLSELNKMIEVPVPEEELENAKRAIVARFALSLEKPQVLTARAVELKYYGLPADYWDRYPAAVAAVTAEDIQRVAKRFLDTSKLRIVAVGDGAKILEVLESFGPVTRYQADGTRVE